MERITGKYFVETPFDVEKAAQVLAGEQSSGTFITVPGETEELKEWFAARVESVIHLETVNSPAIPGVLANYWRKRPANDTLTEIDNPGSNKYCPSVS